MLQQKLHHSEQQKQRTKPNPFLQQHLCGDVQHRNQQTIAEQESKTMP